MAPHDAVWDWYGDMRRPELRARDVTSRDYYIVTSTPSYRCARSNDTRPSGTRSPGDPGHLDVKSDLFHPTGGAWQTTRSSQRSEARDRGRGVADKKDPICGVITGRTGLSNIRAVCLSGRQLSADLVHDIFGR